MEPVVTDRIIDLFERLPLPEVSSDNAESFSALTLPDQLRHRIGKDCTGNACLLVEGISGKSPPSIQLKHLEVRHGIPCRVERLKEIEDEFEETGTFTIIRCIASERILQRHFVQLCETVSRLIGPAPTYNKISESILAMANLFEALGNPGIRNAQGLWSELLLIEQSVDGAYVAQCWHLDAGNLFDFTDGKDRIEVKSTSSQRRIHTFKLEQLYPPHTPH